MNFKKVFAGSLTGALVAAMSCVAFADPITFTADCNTDASAGKYLVDATGADSVVVTVDFGSSYGGGGIGWNSVSTGQWVNGITYSNEDAENVYTVDVSDIAPNEDGSQTFEIQCWWLGDPYTVDYVLCVEEEVAEDEFDGFGSVSFATPVVIEGATGDGEIGLACSFVMEGDAYWNDWCTFVVKVDDENGTNYYVVAGAQVSWDVTVDSENEIVVPVADYQVVPSGDDSYVASIPVTGDYTLTVFTGSWDNAPDAAFINVDNIYTTGGVIEDETDEEETEEVIEDETDEEETEEVIEDETDEEEVVEDETDEEETEEVVDDEDNNDPIGLSYNGPFTLEGATGDGNIGVACSFVMEGEGDAYWNDWCTFVIKVEDENGTNYYVVAGAQVSWDVTVDEENEIVVPVADMMVVPSGDDSYVATIPVKGDYKLSFSTGSWDNAPDAAFIYIDNVYTTGGLDVDDDVEADDTADVAPIAALALMSILGLGVMVASKKRA